VEYNEMVTARIKDGYRFLSRHSRIGEIASGNMPSGILQQSPWSQGLGKMKAFSSIQ